MVLVIQKIVFQIKTILHALWMKLAKDKLTPDINIAYTRSLRCPIASSMIYYQYNETMIYYQTDVRNQRQYATYQVILQNMMAVLTQYIGVHLVYQGDPYIAPYLIQNNQETGISL
eukprot:622881_1